MPHFVYDDTALFFPKTDLTPLPGGADSTKYVQAVDWNTLNQAVEDIKDLLRGSKWYGLEQQVSDPNPGVANYLWLTSTGLVAYKFGGVAINLVPATRSVATGTGLTGGGNLSADRTIALADTAVSPGTYNFASFTVDQQGRITSASSNSVASTATQIIAGAGLTGGGDLSANRTLDVVANADGSIVVNANDIQVGVLATDGQHGSRGGGTQHALAIAGGAAGFLSGTDKQTIDDIPATYTPQTRNLTAGTGLTGGGNLSANRTFALADTLVSPGTYTFTTLTVDQQGRITSASSAAGVLQSTTLTAGAGLTGGGDLSTNRSFAVGAHADGSIVVNADDIQVGVLATDAQHGSRGGGTQHAVAVASGAAGFLSGADKAIIDGISSTYTPQARTVTAGNGLTGGGDLSANRTFDVGAGNGILSNANDVAVDQAYAFNWTADQSWKSHAAFAGSQLAQTTKAQQTTDDTQTHITLLTLADTTVARVSVEVVARGTAGAERAIYGKVALVYREGGGATIQGSVQDIFPDVETSAGLDATITVNSNDVRLSITGLAATTINWVATVRYQAVSGNA